jgi:hypothetical protein
MSDNRCTLTATHKKAKENNTAALPHSNSGHNQIQLSRVQSEMRSMFQGVNKVVCTNTNSRRL